MSRPVVASDHPVSPLELFFDLVFVFGFTQVTTLLTEHPTWTGLGQALLLDGANPAAVRARVTPDVREQLAGSHAPQAQLSDDGNTLYALGPNGGVDSYLAASSRRVRSIATDRQFTALYRLSSGGLAATSLTSPNLTFFDDSLQQVGTADTNFYIDGVF